MIAESKQMFFLIAGPCVIENEEMPFQIADFLIRTTRELKIPLIFKASYKKANRSSLHSFTGIGDEKALNILKSIREKYGIPTITDVHSIEEIQMAADKVDILQIPAFLCRQTELLLAAAQTDNYVNIKKGQFVSAASMKFAAEKISSCRGKNPKLLLTERGSMFGYQDLIVDYRNIPIMQSFQLPVVMDVTHSLQQPNQNSGVSGGHPELIETIAKAAVAVGCDALFMETHPNPEQALSDGSNMLPLEQMPALLEKLIRIKKAIL